MKATLKAWLVRVVLWVLVQSGRLLRWLEPLPTATDPVLEPPHVGAARDLTAHWEQQIPAPGYGEAKRHQVLAALQKAYPHVSKRALCQAIEDALPDEAPA